MHGLYLSNQLSNFGSTETKIIERYSSYSKKNIQNGQVKNLKYYNFIVNLSKNYYNFNRTLPIIAYCSFFF